MQTKSFVASATSPIRRNLHFLLRMIAFLPVILGFVSAANAQASPSAAFVGADTNTQGSWIGTYGSDGYDLAGGPQSPANGTLSYGGYSLQSQSEWTYAGSTSDQRALETDIQGDRVAATWYSTGSFSFDVNFTDTNTHQVALYVLDWDHQGRAETITFKNSPSGTVLDTRSIPNANTSTTSANFNSGTYLVWNISGHVTITITSTGFPNGVASGIFFGSAGPTAPTITSVSNTTFTVGTPGTFMVTSSGSPTPSLTETGMLPMGVSFVDNGNGTGALSGTPAAGTDPTYNISFKATNSVTSQTQSFALTVNPQVVITGPSATFVTSDTKTQGNWIGTYGVDGYDVANGPQSPANGILAYGNYALQNQSEWTYAGTTSDQRALKIDAQGDRTAATWYGGTFSFDVNFTDTNMHQVALYLLDWDLQGRVETITLKNFSSGAVLDTRNIPNSNTSTTATNLGNGTYLVWNISGHVTITIAANSGPNAVAAGIFFGGATSQTPTAPTITSVNNTTFTVGMPGTFTVTSSGSPTPSLSETGTLPTGVNFVDNGNGTGMLSGQPATGTNQAYNISFKASNSVSNQTQSFTLTVNPPVVTTGPSATFVNNDTSTQGNWMGTYGADGYGVAGGPQSSANGSLSYGSYAVQNESEWTYIPSTSDTRGLEIDAQGDRTAATWYGGTFSFDVNLTDTNTHQVTLYLLDWDHQGRVETITVKNYSSGAVLDTRNIPNSNTSTTATNFGNGTYLVWNVSGHITITIVTNGGPNAVAAGIFFGGAPNQTPTAPAITSANNATFTIGQPGTFTVTSSGSPAPSLAETGILPTGVSFVDSGKGTGTLSGTPATGSNPTYAIGFTATNSVTSQTQSFALTVKPAVVSTGPSATFINFDTATQGNWVGKYGGDGYSLAGANQNPPAYDLVFGVQGQQNYTWASSTSDMRALQDGSGRIAATWYGATTFSFDVNITDGNPHQVALYVMDWDSKGRGETVQVLPVNSTVPLNTQTIPGPSSPNATAFTNGVYLVWTISGHVTLQVTTNSGPNAVVSGVFFGGSTAIAPSVASASFVKFDNATLGNWIGKYGSDGYSLAGAGQNPPTYDLTFNVQGQQNFTWTTTTPDPRCLQSVGGNIAAAWYSSSSTSSFSIDVNITDGSPHLFALYALDWDSQLRSEQIQILDAATNNLLDTENISDFTGGVYLVWNITGHVTVTVTPTGGPNAVISGAFFNGNLTNPVPVVTGASPTVIGLGSFTLQVSGGNFVDGSQIMFGGMPLTTTLISSGELSATGTATANQIGNIAVTVQNPRPGGGPSTTSQLVAVETGQAVTPAAAVRFLEQSTFGPTPTLLNQLEQTGFTQFLADQFSAPVSIYPDQDGAATVLPTQKVLFTNALTRPDQLRQRVALVLSEIWVTSSPLVGSGMTPYMQLLLTDAFTNYRTIMQDVTLSPAMGRYLNMANNDKSNPATNTHANENYARELMQLFTIGLIKQNSDGTPQLDTTGDPIPTYDQDTVESFARVFTGWTYPTEPGSTQLIHNPIYWYGPMEAIDTNHDMGSKTLLNGTVLPGGQTAAQDLSAALDNIFSDPDIGPFVANLLIQHLVTSNPSPAYVSRVANAFAAGKYGSFGSGARGDMQAVITAILLDSEARRGDDPTTAVATDGHLREPILFVANLLRAFGATTDGVGPTKFSSAAGEPPLTSPSVFNFFPPNYVIPGTSLLGPEFALQTAATAITRINFVNSFVYGSIDPGTTVDFTPYANLAATGASQLVAALNTLLMHGSLSSADQASILAAVNAVLSGPTQNLLQAQTAIYLIVSSSQYQIEH